MSKAKVWGIGLGRTGTRSLCEALRILGYEKLRHVPPYIQDLDDLEAAAEGICVSHYRYLDLRFPNSKFVLTTRDLDSWLDSCKRAMEDFPKDRISPESPFYNAMIRNRCARYGALEFDSPTLTERFYHHHFDVVTHFRSRFDKLLILDFTKGEQWQKLCTFLDLEIPSVDFPFIRGRTGLGLPDDDAMANTHSSQK